MLVCHWRRISEAGTATALIDSVATVGSGATAQLDQIVVWASPKGRTVLSTAWGRRAKRGAPGLGPAVGGLQLVSDSK
eukprot:534735-Alexandrium_andersonii.AAC.1